ncbi:Plasmid pRiA4b ORF-3-like protein [Leptolyngbya sp. PCC 7375]|nr:Plasmid pRiA4b ORF-3-like protein [Leptolyngbya sp. PCC 7375]
MFTFDPIGSVARLWQMTSPSLDAFSLAPYAELLEQQVITEYRPGLILKDFQTFLDFLQDTEVSVSNVNQLLQAKFFPELNQRLSYPIDVRLTRPVQKSYPYINGLYLLLRLLGLTRLTHNRRKLILGIDPVVLETWQQLNDTERYFALLETWLLRADEDVIGERDGGALSQSLYKLALFWSKVPDEGMTFPTYQNQTHINFIPGLHNLALLHLFGLLDVQTGETAPKQAWRVVSIQKLPLGEALIPLATHTFMEKLTDWQESDEVDAAPTLNYGELHNHLVPFFPEWQTIWQLPGEGFQDGLYIFKVSLAKTWRRIAIPAHLVLDELATAILEAYQFDFDHLYEFSYRDRTGRSSTAAHPACEDPPFTSDMKVGDLSLIPGSRMTFWYDFGDDWKFKVELVDIQGPDSEQQEPKILESQGKSPQQYDWYEE